MAELVAHFFPKVVELHNYSAQHSVHKKLYNWETLNSNLSLLSTWVEKVFKRIGIQLTKQMIDDAIHCVPDTVEGIIKLLQEKVLQYIYIYIYI